MPVSFGKSRINIIPQAVNAPEIGKRFARRYSPFQVYQPATGKSWWLSNGANRIGRGADNDVIVSDASVSRQHARIVVSGGVVYIEDLKSRNGVRVAGEAVRRSTLMTDAIFYLGTAQLMIRRPSVTESNEDFVYIER